MSEVIVYLDEENNVCVVTPTLQYLANHTLNDVGDKDVPEGIDYYFTDSSEIPENKEDRLTWFQNTNLEIAGTGQPKELPSAIIEDPEPPEGE